MNSSKILSRQRFLRKKRTRSKIKGTSQRPRLSVFRSNRYTCVQLIDDASGQTMASASTREMTIKGKEKEKNTSLSYKLGEIIAQKAIEKGVKEAVFDRGDYKYHGRVKALAEGAREGGLVF